MHAFMSESKVNRMIGKRQLIAFVMLVALIMFGVLNFDTVRLSAYESPAIYISPAYVQTEDPESAIGTNYTFSVLTDYDGSDVWGFEFDITYNATVLEGREVVNGGLINETVGTTMWDPGTFNNTEGTLTAVGNGFYTASGGTPPLTSGPGILANITFTVLDCGISNITLEHETRLIGAHDVGGGEWEQFNIIDDTMFGHIEGSVFDNPCGCSLPADANGDGYVNVWDLGLLSDSWLTVKGEPLFDERCDFNGDDAINVWDLGIMSDYWLESC